MVKVFKSGEYVCVILDGFWGLWMCMKEGFFILVYFLKVFVVLVVYLVKCCIVLKFWDCFIVFLFFNWGIIVWGDFLYLSRLGDDNVLIYYLCELEDVFNVVIW